MKLLNFKLNESRSKQKNIIAIIIVLANIGNIDKKSRRL